MILNLPFLEMAPQTKKGKYLQSQLILRSLPLVSHDLLVQRRTISQIGVSDVAGGIGDAQTY